MSTTIQEQNGVSITRFAAGDGRTAFQVTWRSDSEDHLFDFVCFNNLFEATKFAELLENRLVR